MQQHDIEVIARKSSSLHHFLLGMKSAIGGTNLKYLGYGFFVHLYGRERNDFLYCYSGEDERLLQAFLASGGTATDVVANNIESVLEPYQIDLVSMRDQMRDTKDFRLSYLELVCAQGVKTAWITTINEPWVGGYGVFSQFYRQRFADSEIPLGELRAFAHKCHEEARRHRLIAKEIKLRSSQVEVLSQVAKGKSAEDLADIYRVSTRAIEKRLENIRQKLRARNTLEAIYKATIYGVLPSAGGKS